MFIATSSEYFFNDIGREYLRVSIRRTSEFTSILLQNTHS